MITRWMAVALGAVVLAVPGTALAKGDHAKGKGHAKHQKAEKQHKHGKKDKSGKKDKAAKKGKSYTFKGVYKGEGVVTVSGGNSRVRKGGYVGTDVTFDLASAKIVAADSDGVAGISAADVKVGDKVLVQARLPRGTKAPVAEEPAAEASSDEPVAEEAPASIKARKLVVLSRSVSADDDDEAEDGQEHGDEVENEVEPEHSEDD